MSRDSKNVRIVNKFKHYYLEDCDCQFCLYHCGKRGGCKFRNCPYDDIKKEALLGGRIKRKWGFNNWERLS